MSRRVPRSGEAPEAARRLQDMAPVLILLGVVLLVSAGGVHWVLGRASRAAAERTGTPVRSPPPVGLALGLAGAACLSGGVWIVKGLSPES